MRLRMWGTRGSIATPGPSTIRYGGNTSCVELRTDAGTVVVLDCGTGARELGRSLVAESEATGRPLGGHVLLSHTHWDHIQGLPFFEPLFRPGHWHIYGPRGLGSSLAQTLGGQMEYQYFPVAVEHLVAEVEYHELVEGDFEVDGLHVHAQYLNHPALTLGYRLEGDGVAVCYLTDHEPHDHALGAGGDVAASRADGRHIEFMRSADVVIHDAQYTAAEYPEHEGWGHSTVEYVIDAASAAEVRTTVLYHHDPTHDDAMIDDLVSVATARAAGRTAVVAAAEGIELTVVPSPSTRRAPVASGSAAMIPALSLLGASVVVVTDDEVLRREIGAAAAAEGLDVVDPSDGATADGVRPCVALVDVDGDDTEHTGGVPAGAWLVAVTRRLPGAAAAAAVGQRIDDWLVWPAGPAHLRTRLRAAVLRHGCRWLVPPRPVDDGDRVDAVRSLGVLDTAREERFDQLCERARQLFEVPVALITIVDRDRQWFKSSQGVDVTESHRDESVCAYTILGGDVLQVPDLLADPRFAENPAVVGLGARFYAGAPLVLPDGHRVGSLCVADHRPRLLDEEQVGQLRDLADDIVEELLAGSEDVGSSS